MPEAAPGLPDRKRFTPMTTIGPDVKGVFHPVSMPFVMHRHKADRAGLHHDLRIADKNSGVAHSWAYRSGKMPRVGEKIEVHQQPDHTIPYMSFKGKIEEGYGKGTVGIARSGTVEVLDSTAEKLHFRLGRKRFVLIKTPRYSERSWLLIGLPSKQRKKTAMHMVPAPSMAEAMLKAAKSVEEQRADDRAVGQGIGSSATHLVTGYAAGPWLHPAQGVERPTFKSLGEHGLKGSLKRYWGGQALATGATLAGVALVGGAMKEKIQAGYEGWREKRRQKHADGVARAYPGCAKCLSEPMDHCSACRQHGSTDWKTGRCASCDDLFERRHARSHFGKAAEVLEGFLHASETEKTATGLLLYTNNPSERPSAPSPKPTKGFAAHFGGRFNPSVSHHRHAERTSDEWMRGSAEYVDLGMRPSLVQAAREVLQIEPGKPFPRSQALKMLQNRKDHGSTAVTRRRAGVLKGMEEGADSPEDVRELLHALETATKHPRVRYIELTEKN